jgi:hypothetical protein
MRRALLAMSLLLMMTAAASFSPAQPAPGAPPEREGGAPAASANPAFVVSITFADNALRVAADEVVETLAYAASDPELRKRPDFQIPPAAHLEEPFGPAGKGTIAQLSNDVPAFVGNATERANGFDVRMTTNRPAHKAELEAAARRAAESLAPKKLPKEQLAQRVIEIDQQIANLRDKKELLHSVTVGMAKLGPEILTDRIKSAELERQRLEMEVVAQKHRSEAIARQVERALKEVEMRMADDTVLNQLREIVKIREDEAKRSDDLVKNALMSTGEAAAVREKVIAARIRVAEREEALRNSAATTRLERLNDELATIMINQAEMEVRLALLRDQPSLDVKQIDEDKLTRLTEQYRALFRSPGVLPPLYFELEKRQMELRRERLSLIVADVKLAEATSAVAEKSAP